jgi:hypothetical protein
VAARGPRPSQLVRSAATTLSRRSSRTESPASPSYTFRGSPVVDGCRWLLRLPLQSCWLALMGKLIRTERQAPVELLETLSLGPVGYALALHRVDRSGRGGTRGVDARLPAGQAVGELGCSGFRYEAQHPLRWFTNRNGGYPRIRAKDAVRNRPSPRPRRSRPVPAGPPPSGFRRSARGRRRW